MKKVQETLNELNELCITASITNEARKQTIADLMLLVDATLPAVEKINPQYGQELRLAYEMIRIRTNGNAKTGLSEVKKG